MLISLSSLNILLHSLTYTHTHTKIHHQQKLWFEFDSKYHPVSKSGKDGITFFPICNKSALATIPSSAVIQTLRTRNTPLVFILLSFPFCTISHWKEWRKVSYHTVEKTSLSKVTVKTIGRIWALDCSAQETCSPAVCQHSAVRLPQRELKCSALKGSWRRSLRICLHS